MKTKLIIVLFLFFTISNSVYSKEPWQDAIRKQVDPLVAATMVPPFCEDGKAIAIIHRPKKDYRKMWGEGMVFLNHYCYGKFKIPVCYEYPEKEMKACLTPFLEGTTYAIGQNRDPNFPLLPFLYSERGNLHKDIGNYKEAISDFRAAIEKNKRFSPAYLGMADLYIKLKNYDEAEKYIRMGLEHNPNKKSLKSKLEKIKKLKVK
ncbi:tetratricopeptide repeat protein [Methylomonas sp. MgM2]